MKWILQSQWII